MTSGSVDIARRTDGEWWVWQPTTAMQRRVSKSWRCIVRPNSDYTDPYIFPFGKISKRLPAAIQSSWFIETIFIPTLIGCKAKKEQRKSRKSAVRQEELLPYPAETAIAD